MQNKAFSITIAIIIVLLIGFVVWQQINIMGLKSDLFRLESLSDDVASISMDLTEVKSTVAGIKETFTELSDIESDLGTYQKLAILNLAMYANEIAQAEYYLATFDLAKAQSYVDDAGEHQEDLLSNLDTIDELMDEKVALLQGE